MFWFRDTLKRDSAATGGRVHVAFTDASRDLQGLKPGFPSQLADVEQACGARFARMHQVHGAEIATVSEPAPGQHTDDLPHVDALITQSSEVGLMVRVADCVPVLLADLEQGIVAAVHAGRAGVAADIVGRACEAMRQSGAEQLTAWVGPHVCGGCYEVPEALRDEVAGLVPETFAQTTWGTPSLDLAAGVWVQLSRHRVAVHHIAGCTREEPSLHSFRRDGASSGRLAGLIWMERGEAA